MASNVGDEDEMAGMNIEKMILGYGHQGPDGWAKMVDGWMEDRMREVVVEVASHRGYEYPPRYVVSTDYLEVSPQVGEGEDQAAEEVPVAT